jgi:hypothetical protein
VLLLAALPVSALAQSASQPASEARSEARAKVRAACAGDVQKFCANIERARGAMRTCLQSHDAQLSAACKAARAEREAARAKDKS